MALIGAPVLMALLVLAPPLVRGVGAAWSLERYRNSPAGRLTERVVMSARASDDFNSARILMGVMISPQSPAQRRQSEADVGAAMRRFDRDMAGLSVASTTQRGATIALKTQGENVIRKACLPRLDLKGGRLVNLASPQARFSWFVDCTSAAATVQRRLDDLKVQALSDMMAQERQSKF